MKLRSRGAFVGVAIVVCAALSSQAEARDRVGKIVKRTGATVMIGGDGTAFATCRAREKLVGGGARGGETPIVGGIALQSLAPDPGNRRRWLVRANNNGGDDLPLTAYAFCARPAENDRVGKIRKRVGTPEMMNSNQPDSARAKCLPGEKLVGGGALGEGAGATSVVLRTTAPDPDSPRTWLARGMNFGADFQTLTAYAFCSKPKARDRVGRIKKRAGEPISVPPESSKDAFASCQGGEKLVGGAATTDGTFTVLSVFAPDPNNPLRWFVRAWKPGIGAPDGAQAFAYCSRPG